jgi:hypothetical protein
MDLSLIHIAGNIVVNPVEIVYMAENPTGTDTSPTTHIQMTNGHLTVDTTVDDIMGKIHDSLSRVANWGGS